MSGPVAAEVAGITYRQLDYWERKGWVSASSVQQGDGGRRVRRYSPDAVVRLAALRHLAQSGLDVGEYGPQIGTIEIPVGAVLAVGDTVTVVSSGAIAKTVSEPGRWTVFDPAPIRHRCVSRAGSSAATTDDQARKLA
ncbi:MAG: MerR family transcriptional regulator [Actinomycetota bacterium]|nr:MerR family transcriptional regulator [Actinomycetota bacterium]